MMGMMTVALLFSARISLKTLFWLWPVSGIPDLFSQSSWKSLLLLDMGTSTCSVIWDSTIGIHGASCNRRPGPSTVTELRGSNTLQTRVMTEL